MSIIRIQVQNKDHDSYKIQLNSLTGYMLDLQFVDKMKQLTILAM